MQPYHIYLAPGQQQAAGAGGGSGSQGEQQAPSAGEEEPLVFAGLYDVWEGPDGPMHTYTILTTGMFAPWLLVLVSALYGGTDAMPSRQL